jgi:hypothetical protein
MVSPIRQEERLVASLLATQSEVIGLLDVSLAATANSIALFPCTCAEDEVDRIQGKVKPQALLVVTVTVHKMSCMYVLRIQ